MSVKKPFRIGLIIGVLALAFAAVPALANAAQLTHKVSGKSVAVPVGTTVTGTSANAVTKVPGVGNLECENVTVNGIVTTNSGGTVVVGMDGENDTATGCTFAGSATIVKPTLTSINLSSSSNTAAFDFEVLTEAGFVTESSASTVTYTSGSSSIHVAGPVTGPIPGAFSGDFSLEDATGAVTAD